MNNLGKDPENSQAKGMSIFERRYFIQTRKEIDTEKRERDRLLHFAIILLGGVTAVLFQRSDFLTFILSPEGILVEASLLIILTSIFWARWKKLCQIADRWYVLFKLLKDTLGEDRTKFLLEQTVIDDFNKKRYVRKDAVLNFSFCLPIYLCMLRASVGFLDNKNAGWAILSVVLIITHLILSFLLLSRPMKPPANLELNNSGTYQ